MDDYRTGEGTPDAVSACGLILLDGLDEPDPQRGGYDGQQRVMVPTTASILA